MPIPTDVVCAKEFAAHREATIKRASEVADDDLILTSGRDRRALAQSRKKAGTIVWNGPVGVFEFDSSATELKRWRKRLPV